MKLYLDFETRSDVDLIKAGAAAYASHPSTDITCLGFALNDSHIWTLKRRDLHNGPPPNFGLKAQFVAHNYFFEYLIYEFILHQRYGWPPRLHPRGWDCTMARAYACGLPGSLEGVALALNLPFKKDMEGKRAMYKTCRRQKDGTWYEDPEILQTLYRYNANDVEAERAVDKALPPLSPEEREIFELDCLINRRGILIDKEKCIQAREIASTITDALNDDLCRVTKKACNKATQIARMRAWVETQGVVIPVKDVKVKDETEESGFSVVEKETLDIEAIGKLLTLPDSEVPKHVKEALRIRKQVGKSSTKKFTSMLNCACADGRVRGAFQYHGAHTGRWTGKNIQPQNYPQGLIGEEQKAAIDLLEHGSSIFHAIYNSQAMQVLSGVLRGMLIAASNKILIGADYSGIEMRVLNWLAGEQWALDLIAKGGSPYIVMAKAIFNREDLTKKDNPREYDIGKRSELGCGYGMGWSRFQSNVWTETAKRGEGVWIGDLIAQRAVKIYREKHPHVVNMWYSTEAAAIDAVESPGKLFQCANGRIVYGMSEDRKFLCAKLPSGRLIRYFNPSVRQEKDPFDRFKSTLYYWASAGGGALKTECNGMLGWYRTWGGELVENNVQAIARDFMAQGMFNVEANGYPIVIHTHDEIVAETDQGQKLESMINYMTRVPSWGQGCPIAAEGWIGERYRK